MADEKTIRFKFELDNQSFQQVQSAIKSLVSELQKLGGAGGGILGGGGGAFPGLSIGGAAPNKSTQVAQGNQKAGAGGAQQGATMGKVILDNAQAFKKFASEGKDASKIMTDALKRDIQEQSKALDGLKGKLVNLNDEFKLATQRQKEFLAAGDKASASKMGDYIKDVESRIAQTSGQTLQGHKGLLGSQEALAAQGGGPGGFVGLMNKLNAPIPSPFSPGMSAALGGVGKLVGGFATAAIAGVQEYMAGTRMYSGAEAQRGGMVNASIAAYRRGDISDLQARRMILQDPEARKDFMAQRGGASKAETYIEATGSTIADVVSKVTGGISDKLTGRKGGAIGSALTDTNISDEMLRKQQEMIAQKKAGVDFQDKQYATDYYTNNLNTRLQAMRQMGIGLRNVPGRPGGPRDTYGDLDIKLTEQGYSMEQYMGARQQLLGMGGRKFASDLAWTQMAASSAGLGNYGEVVRNLATAGQGGVSEGKHLLGMALGGREGAAKMDSVSGFQLADLASFGGYNAGRGAIDSSAILSMFQNGIGAAGNAADDPNYSLSNQNKVKAFAGALGIMNDFSSGGYDQYQMGKNTVNAAQVLGKGSTTYAIDYLASLPMEKLASLVSTDTDSDAFDETARNLGITQDQAKAFQDKNVNSMLDRYHAQGDNDKIGAAVQRFKKSGAKSVGEYLLNNLGDVGLLGSAVNLGAYGGKQQDTSLALMFAQMGSARGGEINEGNLDIGGLDPAAKAFFKNQADFKRKDKSNLEGQADEMKDDFASLQREAKIMHDYGANLGASVVEVGKALDELAIHIHKTVNPNWRPDNQRGTKPK